MEQGYALLLLFWLINRKVDNIFFPFFIPAKKGQKASSLRQIARVLLALLPPFRGFGGCRRDKYQ